MQPSYYLHQTLLSPSRDFRFTSFFPPSSPIAKISYAPIITMNPNLNTNNNNLDNSFYYQNRNLTPLNRSELNNPILPQETYKNGGGGMIRTEYATNDKKEPKLQTQNFATDNSLIFSKKSSENFHASNQTTLPPNNNSSNLKSPSPTIKIIPSKPSVAPDKKTDLKIQKKEDPIPKKPDPPKAKQEISKQPSSSTDKDKKEGEDLKKLILSVSKKEDTLKKNQLLPPSRREEEPKKSSNHLPEKGSKKEDSLKKEETIKKNAPPSSLIQKKEASQMTTETQKRVELSTNPAKLTELDRNQTGNIKNDDNLKKFICELPGEGSEHLPLKINNEKVEMTVDYLLRRKKPVEEVVRGLVEENLILRELFTERSRENDVLKAMHEGDMSKIEQILQENVKLNHSLGVINGEINEKSELKRKIGGLTNIKESLERENEKLKREKNDFWEEIGGLREEKDKLKRENTQIVNLKEKLQKDYDKIVIIKEDLENENVDLSKNNEKFANLNESFERLKSENEKLSKENKLLLSKVNERETETNETLDAKEKFKKNNFLEKEEINRVKEELRREREELIKTKDSLNKEREEKKANRNFDAEKFNKIVKFSEGLERKLKEQANEIESFKENLFASIQKQESQIENFSSLKSILTTFQGNATGTYKVKIKELQNELLQCHVCISDLEKKLKSQNLDHSRSESKNSIKLRESMLNDSTSSLKKSTHLLNSQNFFDSTTPQEKPKRSQFLKHNSGLNKSQKLDDFQENQEEKNNNYLKNDESMSKNQNLEENQIEERSVNYIKSNVSLNKTQRLEESLIEESDLLSSQIKHWKEIALKNGKDNESLMSLLENKKNELVALNRNYEHLRKENRELKRRMLGMEEKIEGMQKEKQEFKEIIENQSFLMRDREVELEERMSEVDEIRNRYKEAILDISQQY